MPLEDGDLVEFDYELWVEGRDGLYDTTLEAAAKEAGLHDEKAFYAPVVVAVGSGRIIPGLERAVRRAIVGETQEVTLAPADAYGERDPKLIETVPMNEFKKGEVTPVPGLPVNYQNRSGVVVTVGGGRVRVDFNHALSGKTLKYRFTLRRVAQDDRERLEAVLRMDFPSPFQWKVDVATVDGHRVGTVTVPEPALFQRHWPTARMRAVLDAGRWTKLDRVRFVETYPVQPARAQAAATTTPARS